MSRRLLRLSPSGSTSRRALPLFLLVAAITISPAGAQAETDCPAHSEHSQPPSAGSPLEEIGDAAFSALAEAVSALEAEAGTPWSRVDVDALRDHLVDMARVTGAARVEKTSLPAGFRALVLGDDERTVAAIRRMVPAHSRMMAGHRGWRIEVTEIDAGVRITVQGAEGDKAEAERLRGLGFFGFLASGDHHRHHHWMMATGAGHPATGQHRPRHPAD